MKGYLLVVIVATLCIACGGGSGGGSGTSGTTSTTSTTGGGTTANPWAGTYVGRFEDFYGNVGSFSMTVSTSGKLSGQFGTASGGSSLSKPASGSYTGGVNSGGAGYIMIDGGELVTFLGVAKQPTLSVRFLAGANNPAYWATAITNPSGSYGGVNPFAGQYSGTVYYPNLQLTAAVSVVIGSDGAMNGLEAFDLGILSLAIGQVSGTLSSTGSLKYTVGPIDGEEDTTPETLSGNITFTNGSISGTLTDSDGASPVLTLNPIG